MHPTPSNNDLNAICKVEDSAAQILNITQSPLQIAEATLTLAWGKLFDHLYTQNNSDFLIVKTITDITSKLTFAYTQMKSLEIKSQGLSMKEKNQDNQKDSHEFISKSRAPLIKPEAFKQMERELKLL